MEPKKTGPRVLLRRLREVMAETLEHQDKLNKIVEQIAANMLADVCSIYVLKNDDLLELFATKGLNPGAVHKVSLKIGHGLVGSIAASARPLNLRDAQNHPSFELLKKTNEENFNSFMGVPILRAGRVLGVLVVQNKDNRVYRDEEVEVTETTAMVLAELLAVGELDNYKISNGEPNSTRPKTIEGLGFASGIAIGKVYLHSPRFVVTNLFNDNFEQEKSRLWESIGKLRNSIDDIVHRNDGQNFAETREVLETFRMFANDRGWARRLEDAVRTGLTAEAAVEKVRSDQQTRVQRISDPLTRERLHEFEDLSNRLLQELAGKNEVRIQNILPDTAIIVARNMGAAELLNYEPGKIAGLVLEDGGASSHVVIVAKALGIPVVGNAGGIVSNIENGDDLVLDGTEGVIYIRPGEEISDAYQDKIIFQEERQRQYGKLRESKAVSRDGTKVDLFMNAGLLVDLPQLSQSGADGIGLFRTELQFMVSSTFPRPGQQEKLYGQVLDEAGDSPVTFRTLDVGGDKVLPYLRSHHEENPAMGLRALRLALDRPGLLKVQIRALLKAASGRKLRVMLPMVSEVREIRQAKKIIHHEMELLTRFGYQLPEKFELGAMIEVPSILYQLDELMVEVDFASVGSNDLFQFMMASDRGNVNIANRFDQVSRPFVRALQMIAKSAENHGKELTLCGELAGKPLGAMVLAAIGYRSISMSAASIGPIKSLIQHLDIGKLRNILLPAIDDTDSGQTLRELLEDFVDANGVSF